MLSLGNNAKGIAKRVKNILTTCHTLGKRDKRKLPVMSKNHLAIICRNYSLFDFFPLLFGIYEKFRYICMT